MSNETFTIGKYIYVKPAIGKGSFSKVYRGYNSETKEIIAIKKIDIKILKPTIVEKLSKEVELISQMNNENIVRLEEVIKDENSIYIVTEYCPGCLKDILKRDMDEDEIRHYMRQIKNGMEYLLSMNILHRDLKPQNILITYRDPQQISGEYRDIIVKIADFGFAKYFENDDKMFETLCGTPMYMAPEIMIEKRYTISSDLWSIGIIFYELLFKKLPYGRPTTILELTRNIERMRLSIPKDHKLSESCLNLLLRLLQRDITRRITWDEFFDHQFFEVETPITPLDESELFTSALNEKVSQSKIIDSSTLLLELNAKVQTSRTSQEREIESQKVNLEQTSKIGRVNSLINDNYFSNSAPNINDHYVHIPIPISRPISIPENRSNSVIIRNSYKTTPDSYIFTGSPQEGAIYIANKLFGVLTNSIDNIKNLAGQLIP